MNKKKLWMLGFLVLLSAAYPVTAYANSSWHWISRTRPYMLLPAVIVVTLAVEILAVRRMCQKEASGKVVAYVVLGNLLSFAAPYLLAAIIPEIYTFSQMLEHTPFYTVGFIYLLMTLVIETPLVYGTVQAQSANKRGLLTAILLANVATTGFTAVVERVFCSGSW